MADATITNPALLCTMCKEVGTQACNGCHEIRYCSRECQKQDWPLHKLVCKDWNVWYKDARRPSFPGLSGMIRGILFSANETQPRFVWLGPKLHENGTVEIIGKNFADNMSSITLQHIINRSAIEFLERPMGKSIMLSTQVHREEGGPPTPYGPLAKSFQKIDKELAERIHAPILAYGFDAAEQKFLDLGMADLRHVVDFYRVEEDRRLRNETESMSSDKIQGVRVNCFGDCAVFYRLPFEPVEVDIPGRDVGIWDCPAPAKLGIPLVVVKLKPSSSWRGGRTFSRSSALYNEVSHRLTAYEVFDSSLFQGRTTQERHDLLLNQGTLHVVRQDKKPLHWIHLEAMSKYLEDMLLRYAEVDSSRSESPSMTRYLDLLSKEDYMKSYETCLQETKEKQPNLDLASIPSPYEV